MKTEVQENPLVSVIVSIYNIADYLERCITSIIGQTYNHLEIILVNDGSEDDSLRICQSFAEKDKRIIIIDKPNGGLSDARNAGIDIAKGEYLFFVDGDDFVHLQIIESLLYSSKCTCADITICQFISVDCDEKLPLEKYIDEVKIREKTSVNTQMEAVKQLLLGEKYVEFTVVWNKLFRKEVFSGVRFPIGKIHEDDFVMYRLFFNAEVINYLEIELYCYVRRVGSITNCGFSEKMFDKVEAFKQRANFLIQKNECVTEAVLSYLWCYEDYIRRYRQTYQKNRKQHRKYREDALQSLRIYRKFIGNKGFFLYMLKIGYPMIYKQIKKSYQFIKFLFL